MHLQTIKIAFASLILILLFGCSSNAIYRSNFTSICQYQKEGDCESNSLQQAKQEKSAYELAFVEYDDQGQLRDVDQMQAVLSNYQQIAAKEDVLLITFVHGWHHNAAPEDGNIQEFRKVLAKLSEHETAASTQQKRNARKVLGVYIGWRGESIEVPWVNMLTFWDRKNTAHQVGELGVTDLLLQLEEIVNVTRGLQHEAPKETSSRMVVVGHSFGGAVVFGALQKVLMDRFTNSERGKTYTGDAKGFGDLVVLINPAFEAIRYGALFDVSQRGCRAYFPSQLPKLAIMTSESDYATKIAFPMGRFFSTLFESHKTMNRHICEKPGEAGKKRIEISEGSADRTTVGHFDPFLTHDLIADDSLSRDYGNFQFAQLQQSWSNNNGSINFDKTKLESRNISTHRNPYLNIYVDKKLIPNHNDIWGDQVISFLRDLITISTTPQ